MDQDRTNFKAWYADALELLYPMGEHGVAAFMISLPLLERYLRQSNKLSPDDNLNPGCWRTLRALFPTLPSDEVAKDFWTAYRHGFLHQATMSLRARTLPAASLTHDIVIDPVTVNRDGSFVVHPVLFSKLIVRTIEANFAAFVGEGSSAPPLPKIVATVAPPDGINVPPISLNK